MQMLNGDAKEAAVKYHVHQFGSEPHDLHIRIGLQSFNLHRSIAAMRSEYLVDLMKKKPLTAITDLVLEDIPADTFLEICRWMYGSQLQISAHNICTVWNVAKKLQILELVEKCRQYLSSIGSHHRSCHDKQREFQSIVSKRIQPQLISAKVVTFALATHEAEQRPTARISEQTSETGTTPKRKPVSLEKLLHEKAVENRTAAQVASPASDEWLTISEEEIIGSETEDTAPRLQQDRARILTEGPEVPKISEKAPPSLARSANLQRGCTPEEYPEMVLVKTCKLPKLAFLVDRSHLLSNSKFLKGELERPEGNCITLHHTNDQTVSNVLQWSLGGSQPLSSSNVRATLQLTSQLQMFDLSAKCLKFWRNCICHYLQNTPTEASAEALVVFARSDWPLLGPYPFLIDLVVSRMQCPPEASCIVSSDRGGALGHAQMLAKALTGRNPRPSRNVVILPSECVKTEVAAPVPSPSKPAIPASIKILGLRRTLELLNSRKTHTKTPTGKPNEPRPEPNKTTIPAQAPTSQARAAVAASERQSSPKPAASRKTVTSLHVLANRKDSVRKRSNPDKEIK